MPNDPKILGIAFLGGILPSLLWLWFWLKEEDKKEPKRILTLVFIMGMLSIILVLPIQKFIQAHIHDANLRVILWATTEELLKYLAVLVILYKSTYTKDPIDWPIYMVTAALGFAGLENILFLIKPLTTSGTIVGLLTGELRFLGATLLHTVTSGIIGIAIGFSLHKKKIIKKEYFIIGLITAVTLHSLFNFFIIQNNGTDFLKVFLSLWIVTIVVMLFFEKIRKIH